MRTKHHIRMAAILMATALTLTACGGQTPTLPESKTLTIGFTLEPPTLDFTIAADASIPQLLLYNVYETLVKVDSGGAIKPLLATSYEVSSDGTTYTFHLDPAAKFASGTAVDADAVIASLNRTRNATLATLKAQMAVIDNLRAVDSHTVEVTLTQPSNFWLYDMTSSAGMIIDPASTDLAADAKGSGPYMFGSWNHGDRIILKKNPAYWGKAAPFDQVTFRYMSDANAVVSSMLSGDLDMIGQMTSPDAVPQFSDTTKYQVVNGTTTGEVTLGFNHSKALGNQLLRQAICYAIDRKGLLDTVWGGYGTLIGSMVAPTDPFYEDLSGTYPYDPEKAKQLIAQAGVTNPTLSLRVPVVPYATAAATFVASQLKQVGITVNVEELDFNRWYTEVFTGGDYDMTIVAHMEPRDIVNFANPDYYWHYNNSAFQALVKQADAAPTSDEFVKDMKQAAKTLAADAAADWLFLFPNLVVARANITGIPLNSTSLSFDLTTISPKG